MGEERSEESSVVGSACMRNEEDPNAKRSQLVRPGKLVLTRWKLGKGRVGTNLSLANFLLSSLLLTISSLGLLPSSQLVMF